MENVVWFYFERTYVTNILKSGIENISKFVLCLPVETYHLFYGWNSVFSQLIFSVQNRVGSISQLQFELGKVLCDVSSCDSFVFAGYVSRSPNMQVTYGVWCVLTLAVTSTACVPKIIYLVFSVSSFSCKWRYKINHGCKSSHL